MSAVVRPLYCRVRMVIGDTGKQLSEFFEIVSGRQACLDYFPGGDEYYLPPGVICRYETG